MPEHYQPEAFESKWRERWREADLFATRMDPGRPKFYGLDFFPYPSGAGLSVGHCRNYVPTDVLCRKKRMEGYNVLHPMGFDAFGLPAENEAIAKKLNPAQMIEQYAANYRRQMDLIGISYDWSRSFRSSDPSYYKWTQWIFELLYKRGLAYRKLASVNWCPKDKTALANEEVVGGLCERCGTPVEKRWIPQWFFKITDYAQRLIDDLDTVDWPEGIKEQQRNWIGRSEGVEFNMSIRVDGEIATPEEVSGAFQIVSSDKSLTMRVFTTRIDTIYGVTFCVISPEHHLVDIFEASADETRQKEIRAYREATKLMSEIDRQATGREKTGVFSGAYAINPATGKKVPIWIADYVMMNYGTGAIMAVPGHDERDFEFATKFGLPIVCVIAPSVDETATVSLPHSAKDGVMVNSGEYSGMSVVDGQRELSNWIEALGIGEKKVNYRLRDWLISRQRYWGCPIPVIHTSDGEVQLVPEEMLPIYLPRVDHYEPTGDGSSPLALISDFVNVTDNDGRLGRRETDTMGGFACSSWYFLRFCDPHNEDAAWDRDLVDYWMPVDCYVGGAEHAVMHLLYARFWTKVLYDAGLISVIEPFQRLMNQGQVLGLTPYRKPREGESLGVGEEGILVSFDEAKTLPKDQVFHRWVRMSKSRGNVVTPDEVVASDGADALRIYELFVAPFEADVEWSSEGLQGARRFLNRVFRLVDSHSNHYVRNWREYHVDFSPPAQNLRQKLHATIAKVSDDIDRFAFNTAVAAMMTLLNDIGDFQKEIGDAPLEDQIVALSETVQTFVLLLSPMAPFSADELWEMLGEEGFTLDEKWPEANASLLITSTVTIAIQVNGKLRETLEVATGSEEESVVSAAKLLPKVANHLAGKTVRKVIFVPDKLVNIVAS